MASKLSGRQWRGVSIVVVVLSLPFVSHCEKPKQEQAATTRAAPAPLTPEQRAADAAAKAEKQAAKIFAYTMLMASQLFAMANTSEEIGAECAKI